MFNEVVARAYRILVQKSQAGIRLLAEEIGDPKLYHPKHLRVGINNQIVEHCALGKLLVDKGVFTWGELGAAYIIAYEQEVERLEQEIFDKTGVHVTLDVPPGFE